MSRKHSLTYQHFRTRVNLPCSRWITGVTLSVTGVLAQIYMRNHTWRNNIHRKRPRETVYQKQVFTLILQNIVDITKRLYTLGFYFPEVVRDPHRNTVHFCPESCIWKTTQIHRQSLYLSFQDCSWVTCHSPMTLTALVWEPRLQVTSYNLAKKND